MNHLGWALLGWAIAALAVTAAVLWGDSITSEAFGFAGGIIAGRYTALYWLERTSSRDW